VNAWRYAYSYIACIVSFFLWRNSRTRAWGSLIVEASRLYIIRLKTGKTPLKKWSVPRRGRYPQNKHKKRKTMSSAGFEAAILAIKHLQTARPSMSACFFDAYLNIKTCLVSFKQEWIYIIGLASCLKVLT